jgi:lipoprotein-anchoring transpeptidase ErfK/SrfK
MPARRLAALAVAGALGAAWTAGCGGDAAPRGSETDAPSRPATRQREGPIRLDAGERGEISWRARLTRPVPARAAPRADAPAWGELPERTPYSGRPAELLVTGAYRDTAGAEWLRVLLAMRPSGSTAWIPRSAVRLSATRVRVRVDLSARRLDLLRDGHVEASFPAGVGRPDYPTPVGTFAVEDVVPTTPRWRRAYGRYVLTLTAYSPVLTSFMGGEGQSAIHGSGSLGRVGRASSFGCVVLADGALATLYRTARPGTPVEIRA